MKKKKITGEVVYQNLEMGFWGIVDDKGRQYRPVEMPEQLKHEGRQVTVTIEEADEEASIFMWGTPVKILSFETLMP